MRRNSVVLAVVMMIASACGAQVVSPVELKDPELRALQQQYMDDLKQVGQDVLAIQFDYPFYLSRKLDIDQSQQQRTPQSSIRFDHFNNQVVLAVTGNYFAAYPAETMSKDQRARNTFLNVVLPILNAAVPRFQSNTQVKGYAVEISHHILGKVMGVSMERAENLMVYLPQDAAIRLVASKDESIRQAALLQGHAYLNAEPITIWFSGDEPQLAANNTSSGNASDTPTGPKIAAEIIPSNSGTNNDAVATNLFTAPKPTNVAPQPVSPPRDLSPDALSALQVSQKDVLDKLIKDLDPQAHFVSYAAPAFVAFRQSIYLELSLNTTLSETAEGSRYKLAALAFDDHVAHLVRPVLGYFKADQSFDGISFSTTVHLPGKTAGASTSEAVEFFFPFSALRCYERYDCTGQQLIDAGTVLVNGERVGLDLQVAEER
jgi:hypothetical protein